MSFSLTLGPEGLEEEDWMNELHWLYNKSDFLFPTGYHNAAFDVRFFFSMSNAGWVAKPGRFWQSGGGGGEERLVTLPCNNRRGGAEAAWSTTWTKRRREWESTCWNLLMMSSHFLTSLRARSHAEQGTFESEVSPLIKFSQFIRSSEIVHLKGITRG